MRVIPLLLAATGALGVAAASTPARADWDDHDAWRRHEWREHEWRERRWWREHEWRERAWGAYAPPPAYYVPPPAVYAPPPAYYVPPPAYYAPPPPPPVYGAPGVSIGFGFR